MRSVLRTVHATAAFIAMAMIVAFLAVTLSTLGGGAVADAGTSKAVVWYGVKWLVVALAAAGMTGKAMCRGRPGGLAAVKFRRMKIVAANGILILVPCAYLLYARTQVAPVNGWYAALQIVEIAAGIVNLALLAANMRDGLRMRARRIQ